MHYRPRRSVTIRRHHWCLSLDILYVYVLVQKYFVDSGAPLLLIVIFIPYIIIYLHSYCGRATCTAD